MPSKKNDRKIFYVENLIYLFIILNPILDIISFLIRNKFSDNPETATSITALIRPIIPIILSVFVFLKASNETKRKLLLLIFVYVLYAIEHMLVCLDSFKEWSYGTPMREVSFLISYTFFIINLIVFKSIIGVDSKLRIRRQSKEKVTKRVCNSVVIALAIYIVSIFISIITKTSSYTYPEVNIGYKGWIESGNSLSIFLIVAFGFLLSMIKIPKNKHELIPTISYIVLAIATMIYLVFLMGTRVGLYGSFIILVVWALLKLIIDKDIKLFIIGLLVVSLFGIGVYKFGTATFNRRGQLEKANQDIIEEHTIEPEHVDKIKDVPENKEKSKDIEKQEDGKNHVTKDIGDVHDRIKKNDVSQSYMTIPQKESIKKLYEEASQKQIDSNDNRSQQLIYHINLVKQEGNVYKVFFGNGFQTPPGELILEKEFFALLFNFGICGFILYFSPILIALIWAIAKILIYIIKNRKQNMLKVIRKISSENYLKIFLLALVVALSIAIGYILFNISNSTLIATIIILLYNKLKEEI